ncbi:MAG: hypothetical protein WAW06_04610 [bacterium]
MGLRLVCIAGLCLVAMGWTACADASLLANRTPQQIGADSDVVVRGRVESSQSYWNDRHTKVLTRVRIAVDQTYKGPGTATLDLIQLGGTVGTMKVTAHGTPTWKVGEEVLVFAERDKAGSYQVSGLAQGKFKIVRDAKTGEAFVVAPPEETRLLGAPAGPAPRTAGPGQAMPGVPLDEFVERALGRASGVGVER